MTTKSITAQDLRDNLWESLTKQIKSENTFFTALSAMYKANPSTCTNEVQQVISFHSLKKGDQGYQHLANSKSLVKAAHAAKLVELGATWRQTRELIDAANGITDDTRKAARDKAKADKETEIQKRIDDAKAAALHGLINLDESSAVEVAEFARKALDRLAKLDKTQLKLVLLHGQTLAAGKPAIQPIAANA